jgi:hypothetical protein
MTGRALLQAFSRLRWRDGSNPVAEHCGGCRHFRNDSRYLETAIPGLASLSSGAASVRADDGLCLLLDRYLSARAHCVRFAAASTSAQHE